MADVSTAAENGGAGTKSKPIKSLPSDRLIFEKQLGVLRAYAASAGPERTAVSIADVARVAELNPNTISICNPFFQDIGLITREGHKFRPSDVLFDLLQAHKWNAESAPLKLKPAIESSWFAKTLLTKLTFRPLSKAEALQFLAEEVKASKEYEANLALLLDYMKAAGLVMLDNSTITLVDPDSVKSTPPNQNDSVPPREPLMQPPNPPANVRVFSIPIPGKEAATVTVPVNLDADDWEMLQDMIATYVKRWKGFTPANQTSTNKKGAEDLA